MIFTDFQHIAEALHAGNNAGEQLQTRYAGYVSKIVQSWGYKQNSAKAMAWRVITMLENRIRKDKDKTVIGWSEEKVKSTLLEYSDQQRIISRIRASKTLIDFPPEDYFGLESSLMAHLEQHRMKGSIPANFSVESGWIEARDKTIDIFLEKIQAPGFVLTSSLGTYLSGIGHHVINQMISEKYALDAQLRDVPEYDDEFLPEDFETDRKTLLFSRIDREISLLKNNKCRSLLRSVVELFGSITENEKIDYSEVRSLRKVAIQELGKLLAGEGSRTDKTFENCRKRFVIESFPKIQAEYGSESPFSPEYIELMVRVDRQKLERERKTKRDWKAENNKTKKESGDGIY
jgi:hypothetical protein